MKYSANILAVVMILICGVRLQAAEPPTTAPSTAAMQSIFNGKDLAGWKAPQPNLWWKVVDGVLVGENDPKLKGNNLFTDKIYLNCEFECEYRYAAEGDIDTGVHLRQPLIEVQMGFSRTLKIDKTGSVYQEGPGGGYVGNAIGVEKIYKPGQWNKVRFIADGDVLKIWLNDALVLETSLAKYPGAWPLGLEVHTGVKMRVEFRNIKAREL